MNMLTTSAIGKTFRNVFAATILTAAMLFAETASAQTSSQQTITFADNQALHTQTTGEFKVAVFPMANSLILKVVLENPNKEKVTVLIKNNKDEIVYRKIVGRDPVIHGKFDVSTLTDGGYKMVIESSSQSYSNSFSVQTHQERIARAL